jgi:hypothetical protein
MNRLLILACSQRKRPAKGLLPAVERYDGPAFLVLRRYLREVADDGLTVLVLSAKYGLISADRRIPDYDQRLTRDSARKLQSQVLATARAALAERPFRSVGVCAGKDYQLALNGLSALVPEGVPVAVIGGGLGPRLTALRRWLRSCEAARRPNRT